MKSLMYFFVLLMLCFVMVLPVLAVVRILGSNIDNTPPLIPVCASFNIVDNSLINAYSTGTGSENNMFVVAPAEAVNSGRAYALAATSVPASGLILAYFGLDTFSQLNTNQISSGNSPDSSSAFTFAYDTFGARLLVFNSQAIVPCDVTHCLHIREFQGVTEGTGAVLSGVQNNDDQMSGVIINSDFIYVQTFNNGGPSFTLQKIGRVSFVVNNSVVVGASKLADLADDGTFLYGINNSINAKITRITKSDLTLTTFDFSANASNFSSAIAFFNDFLYVADGNNPSRIHKIAASTMTYISNIALGANEFTSIRGLSVDPTNQKLYVFGSIANSWSLRRVDISTFVSEQQLSIADGGRTGWIGSPDFITQKFWFVDTDSPSHLHKVSLC
jgi:hypothetical protein